MSERGDAAIKLFGKSITLQCGGAEEKAPRSKDSREEETAPESPDSQETNEHESTRNSTPEERRSDAGSWKEKAARKPLPCPRCGSPDTKFCYYNNHNVNQPRHFCRNCQRHWTAGGAMRNVPVGAGRRKNRSSSHDRHVALRFGSDAAGNNGGEQSSKQWEGTSSFPVAFYPAVAQWSWSVLPGIWTTPWLSPVASSSPGSSSPTIRKRSRMDDPEEAVRSSVFKASSPRRTSRIMEWMRHYCRCMPTQRLSLDLSTSTSKRVLRSAAVGERRRRRTTTTLACNNTKLN